jgi:hypothetical protein
MGRVSGMVDVVAASSRSSGRRRVSAWLAVFGKALPVGDHGVVPLRDGGGLTSGEAVASAPVAGPEIRRGATEPRQRWRAEGSFLQT